MTSIVAGAVFFVEVWIIGLVTIDTRVFYSASHCTFLWVSCISSAVFNFKTYCRFGRTQAGSHLLLAGIFLFLLKTRLRCRYDRDCFITNRPFYKKVCHFRS